MVKTAGQTQNNETQRAYRGVCSEFDLLRWGFYMHMRVKNHLMCRLQCLQTGTSEGHVLNLWKPDYTFMKHL